MISYARMLLVWKRFSIFAHKLYSTLTLCSFTMISPRRVTCEIQPDIHPAATGVGGGIAAESC